MSHSLDDLRPEFRALVDPWLADCAAAGMDILVTCTLRTLAVIDATRSPAFPDVPTVKEAGGPDGFTQTAWYALVAPAKTPRPVIDMLYQKVSVLLKRQEIRSKLLADSSVPWPVSPDERAAIMKAEAPVYARAIQYVK